MERFAVIGTVPKFSGREFSLTVENGEDLQKWWRENDVATVLTTAAGRPRIRIRGIFAAACAPGSKIRLTIGLDERNGGRRIRGLSVEQL